MRWQGFPTHSLEILDAITTLAKTWCDRLSRNAMNQPTARFKGKPGRQANEPDCN